MAIDESLRVQIVHLGAFDDEPVSIALMNEYLVEIGKVLYLLQLLSVNLEATDRQNRSKESTINNNSFDDEQESQNDDSAPSEEGFYLESRSQNTIHAA